MLPYIHKTLRTYMHQTCEISNQHFYVVFFLVYIESVAISVNRSILFVSFQVVLCPCLCWHQAIVLLNLSLATRISLWPWPNIDRYRYILFIASTELFFIVTCLLESHKITYRTARIYHMYWCLNDILLMLLYHCGVVKRNVYKVSW